MIKHTILTLTALGFLAVPALASHCPSDAAAIDNALSNMEVSDEIRTEVEGLRDKGMELHNAGNHRESEAALAEGMRLLLNNVEK